MGWIDGRGARKCWCKADRGMPSVDPRRPQGKPGARCATHPACLHACLLACIAFPCPFQKTCIRATPRAFDDCGRTAIEENSARLGPPFDGSRLRRSPFA